jgi:putative cross-wall-targeting lipoprotein signal
MQQKQIFGFRKSKLTKNLTGAVLGAALLRLSVLHKQTHQQKEDSLTESRKKPK